MKKITSIPFKAMTLLAFLMFFSFQMLAQCPDCEIVANSDNPNATTDAINSWAKKMGTGISSKKVIQLCGGEYIITKKIILPDNVKLRGIGSNETTLNFQPSVADSDHCIDIR